MRKLVLLLLLYEWFSTPLYAQQTPKSFDGTYDKVGYLEYLPPGYDTATHNFPVLIFLHGSGEEGDGSPAQLEYVKAHGPPQLIESGHDMCFTVNGVRECFIVISPQLNHYRFVWETIVSDVIKYIHTGSDHYKADPNRIYLTGLSLGGVGTYSYASSPFNYPNNLAAIAPVAAKTENYGLGCKISARKIAVWAFHGRKDTLVPWFAGREAFNSVFNCIDPPPTQEMIFTTYEETYHDSWIQAYDTSHDIQNPNLYEWLLRQTRAEVITGLDKPREFSIYPNPASSDLTLTFDDQASSSHTIKIQNLMGEPVVLTEGVHELNISGLAAGVYVVQLEDHSGVVATRRLVKIK